MGVHDPAALARASALLAAAGRVVALTGAGVSTDSGIPAFRGPQGVWTRDPAAARTATLAHYLADPQVRARAWSARREHPAWQARPNAAHRALVELERRGRLPALLTQNVDGLHQRAGSAPERVLELHGTIWQAQCLSCGARTPMAEELARLDDATPEPPCRACGGILKSATVSFGQALDPVVWERAHAAAAQAEVFLAVGSTLSVYPAAGLCDVAVEHGARLVVVNGEPTPYDELARRSGGAVLHGRIGELLPALVAGSAA